MGADNLDLPIMGFHLPFMSVFAVMPENAVCLVEVHVPLLLREEQPHVFVEALKSTSGTLTDVDRPLLLGFTKVTSNLVTDSLTATADAFPGGGFAWIAFLSATSSFETVPYVLPHKL